MQSNTDDHTEVDVQASKPRKAKDFNENAVAILLSNPNSPQKNRSSAVKFFSFARPLFQSKKHNKSKFSNKEASSQLKSARKSADTQREDRLPRKVSFSPSIEEIKLARPLAFRRANTVEAADYGAEGKQNSFHRLQRRASYNDSIGRSYPFRTQARKSSLQWDNHTKLLKDKDSRLGAFRTKAEAMAIGNALALEQIIHAGASIEVTSLEALKEEREIKTNGKRDKEKVQMISAVSPRKVQALKKALLDTKTAVGVINELQRLKVRDEKAGMIGLAIEESSAADSLQKREGSQPLKTNKKALDHPVKAVYLDCTEAEMDKRHNKAAPKAQNIAQERNNQNIPSQNVESTTLPSILTEFSPVTLVANSISTNATFEAVQVGTFDALATLSGVAVRVADSSIDHTLEVHPPYDRMAAFIRWWGYEITLPPPSLQYLGTARSVSSAVFTILQTMAVTGGIPELLPFIRYLSSFVDMEFTAIKSQDKGNGVVLAATWLMPMALVPRPWDYPDTSTSPEISTPFMPGVVIGFQATSSSPEKDNLGILNQSTSIPILQSLQEVSEESINA